MRRAPFEPIGSPAPVPRVSTTACWTAALLATALGASAAGAQIEGFTEPYRTLQVAAAEPGVIRAMRVREGDAVRAGDELAHLDQEVYEAVLRLAEKNMQLKGRLESCRAELRLRKLRHEKLAELQRAGHARKEEVERAAADMAIAEANVLAAEEDLTVKQLEYEKIKAQLERRIVRAPIDGVVLKIHKDLGEFATPNDPAVVTLVQLDQLVATFSISPQQLTQLAPGQRVPISFQSSQPPVSGIVELVSPVNDAESNTVRVKVRVPNPSGRLRSGQRCSLLLGGGSPSATTAARP